MKKFKLLLAFLFCAGIAEAGADRFGNARGEIARSSFTDTTPNLYVVIASATAEGVGAMVVRSIVFSGMAPSTITFYDCNRFTSNVTTAARIEYVPNLTGALGGSGSQPIEVNVDLYISSGIMYSKQGTAPTLIKWDWLTAGEYKGKRGDPRP